MSVETVPVWKQAILARKRQQEEAEKRKQQEKEQYLASLPPWKRAMLKRKEDEAGQSAAKEGKESSSPLVKPRNTQPWKQQVRTRKDSTEKDDKPVQNDISSKAPENTARDKSISLTETKGIAHSMKGKFEPSSQSRVETVKPSMKEPTVETVKQPSLQTAKQPSEPAKQPSEEATKQPSEKQASAKLLVKQPLLYSTVKEPSPVQDVKREPEKPSEEKQVTSTGGIDKPKQRRVSLVLAQAQSIDNIAVGDDRFKAMPKWKQDLIIRKKQQQHQQKIPENVSPKTSPKTSPKSSPNEIKDHKKEIAGDDNRSPVKSSTFQWSAKSSSPVFKTPPVSFAQTSPSTERKVPEVVNASDKAEPDSPKLLHKEGKQLKPPVFQVKSKWADLDENDPEFKNLPEWKRTLILRRKNDFKNRTAPPKEEKKEEKPKEVNEPLPAPLWTPTRSVTVKEVPKEPEKVEVNPLMDMRKKFEES